MEIKEFVRSLSADQLKGLIRFSKHRLRGGITGAIEDHLEGNSEDFEFVFGDPADDSSKANQTHPGTNPPKAATEGADPAVKRLAEAKMAEYNKGLEVGKKMAEFNETKNFAHLRGQR
ncbi:MAG TPA: hypothetical protein VGE44_14570 [Daejeonella sp.]|uniref:hypothetical protein n=1 Tax=Daejeonella sp. TaxID=2805397 RepID=UPI002ED8B87D